MSFDFKSIIIGAALGAAAAKAMGGNYQKGAAIGALAVFVTPIVKPLIPFG